MVRSSLTSLSPEKVGKKHRIDLEVKFLPLFIAMDGSELVICPRSEKKITYYNYIRHLLKNVWQVLNYTCAARAASRFPPFPLLNGVKRNKYSMIIMFDSVCLVCWQEWLCYVSFQLLVYKWISSTLYFQIDLSQIPPEMQRQAPDEMLHWDKVTIWSRWRAKQVIEPSVLNESSDTPVEVVNEPWS